MKNNNLIIIRTEGGLCSQIYYASLGQYFANKGYKVKYDLEWFEKHGMDNNGILARNYDMPKAFPNLHLEIATEQEIELYKRKYRYSGNISLLNSPPHCILVDFRQSAVI